MKERERIHLIQIEQQTETITAAQAHVDSLKEALEREQNRDKTENQNTITEGIKEGIKDVSTKLSQLVESDSTIRQKRPSQNHSTSTPNSKDRPNTLMVDYDDEFNNNNYANNYAFCTSTSDPLAGIHLAELTSNLNTLRPEELYRDSIQGALTLNKWISRIEVLTPNNDIRIRLALFKMHPEIQERLGDNFYKMPWDTLKEKLYN